MIDRFVDDLALLLCAFIGVGLLWQGLEALLYGEIRPSTLDSIIALVWLAVALWAYGRGFKNGKRSGE